MADALRVLVIDDDPAIRAFLADVLESDGYQVRTAGDGAAAFEVLDVFAADVVMLDAQMPTVDGPTFLRQYRQRAGTRGRVLGMAASLQGKQRLVAAGVDAALDKPFELPELLGTVASLTTATRQRA